MAVLVRQTNIIWLGFLAVEHILDIFDRRMEQPVPPRSLNTSLHLRVSKKNAKLHMLYICYCCIKLPNLQHIFNNF